MKIIVLAGGSGTRLWPYSRRNFPKQFLNFENKKTLFQQTLEHLNKAFPLNDFIIITNQEYKFLVHSQLHGLEIGTARAEPHIILEPISRNTAPAIALAIKYCFESLNCDEDEVVFITPSDHIIRPVDKFLQTIKKAEKIAHEDFIVTFGIVPKFPHTGYGYIKVGANLSNNNEYYIVEKFVEKPDIETAKKYLTEGNYYWNSGMFAFKIKTIKEEFRRSCPDIWESLNLSFKELLDEFSKLPNISIDYAVMEKSKNIVMLPLKIYWNDVGSWNSVYEEMSKDEAGNVILGDVIIKDVKNSLILSKKRLIAAIDVEDLVIVETEDAILVSKKDKSQKVKELVEELKKAGRKEEKEHITVFKPWGSYTLLDQGLRYKVKKLTLDPGAQISLQRHFHRSEHWVVVKGTAIVKLGDKEIFLTENQSIYVPKTEIHRLQNCGKIPLEIIEVQVGEYIEEDDIVRFEDKYNREK